MKWLSRAPPALLAMQKVEGSNPFSRSPRKPAPRAGFRLSGLGLYGPYRACLEAIWKHYCRFCFQREALEARFCGHVRRQVPARWTRWAGRAIRDSRRSPRGSSLGPLPASLPGSCSRVERERRRCIRPQPSRVNTTSYVATGQASADRDERARGVCARGHRGAMMGRQHIEGSRSISS
jgi:hypothetical protein